MRWIRIHWQNLTDNKRMEHYEGSIMRHGRAWLHIGRKTLGWEWVFWTIRFNLSLTVNRHDDDLTFSFGIPGVQLYWSVQGFFPNKWKTWDLGRCIGLRIHSGSIWLDIWTDENGWSRDMPWYAKTKSWNPADFFLGRTKHSEREIEARDAVIPMLEKDYPVKVTISESTWKRSRWPFSKKMLCAEVKPIDEGGVPVPGKGESEWNCGEDAIHSSSFEASGVTEAVAKFTASILETRGRYGGTNWKPQEAK